MPSLAGKPPFATDEPDSFYQSPPPPQPRLRQPAPANPSDRTSAYNVYDNYLDVGGNEPDRSSSRQSGVGALGMGLMNMSDSDDDSDDDEPRKNQAPPASKNAALAAATGVVPRSPTASPPRLAVDQVPQARPQPTRQGDAIIAAPRPGYPAPIAALNLARPENASTRAPPPKPIQIPTLENPFEPPNAHVFIPGVGPIPASPSPSIPPSSPHPLQPPITPITPVFARPAKSPAIAFSEPIPRAKPIMRSGNEDALLPRRGERGDDFWRRFSMVAKIENKKPTGSKESRWLKKTQSGTTRLSRWVWIIGMLLVLCIISASVLGWWFSRTKPAHQAPAALGGSANERPVATTSSGAPKATASAASTAKHVSPTHTVARRGSPEPTAAANLLKHNRLIRQRRLFEAVIVH